ncbi:MAG: hypothetical protein E7301_03140 [Butyrivibrio sp.]|nr:hypothetical protein [Butyrivibrio sp.]
MKKFLVENGLKRIACLSLSVCMTVAAISVCGDIPGARIRTCITANAAETVISRPAITELSNEYEGVKVTFKGSSDAEGYYVFRRQKSTQQWLLVGTVYGADATSYVDDDAMKDGGIYTYMVRAFCGENVSADSATKTITRVIESRIKVKLKFGQKAARKMHKMVNEFRTGSEAWAWNSTNSQKVYMSGLAKLSYDYTLEKIAMLRAAEIAIKFAHERPNGKDCFSAYGESGYIYTAAGENIAYGYKSASAAFKAFQETNSYYVGQGHRRNMLGTSYNVCAFGHVKLNGVNYWVQEFANTTEDSDYTKAVNGFKKVSIDVAADDISQYKKTIKSLNAKIKDYPPRAVTINTAEVLGKKVALTYTRSNGAAGYEIYRSTKKNKGYTKIGTVKKQDTLTFTDKKASRKKKYYYYVVPYRVAHGDKIYGKKSNIIIART